jgi:hypothetical protein
MGMRICLIARNRFHGDRGALATYRVLNRAGHEVLVVAVDGEPPRSPVTRTVPRRVASTQLFLRLLQRFIPRSVESRSLLSRLTTTAAELDADIYLPLHGDVLEVAVAAASRTGGVVQRQPSQKDAGDVDLIFLAPAQPQLAQPVPGMGAWFTPADTAAPHEPEASRCSGERAVICFRKTDANPGRYLESALRRAGFEVRLETEAIDLSTVDPDTAFILFVEGPYPAIEVSGATQVPILFWAHHGEHHLFANLRLADRYRADAVLLAHSWHLAHWFPAPVHRFPFAVPAELFKRVDPLASREFDVAMVGSKLRGDAWQYQRRSELIADLESHLSADRLRLVEGVTPEKMAELYGNSRVVINEGGTRHYPITMRIFEAIGAGAVLLTDEPPGLEVLFHPGRDYLVLGDDVVADVEGALLDLGRSQTMADGARDRAMGLHTYDHRVDQLMEIASQTQKRDDPPVTVKSELGRVVDADVEVQRLVHDGIGGLDAELPDREVWPVSERSGRLSAGSVDAAVVASDTISGNESLIDSARRYVYAVGDVDGLDEYLQTRHPDAVTYQNGDVRRIDLMTEAYRVKSAGSQR